MKRVLSLALSGALAVASIGCYSDPDTNTQIGAAAGGLIGAGLGAVIGAQTGDPGAGVAIGSVAGALAGGAVGNKIDAQEKRYASNEERLQRQERELGSTRREIQGLRRSQDDSSGVSAGAADGMRARPGRIVAKEDMSTSTRARLAQMAAEGKVVDPFAGKSGSVVDLEGEEQARAGLKVSKKSKASSANRAVVERKNSLTKVKSNTRGDVSKGNSENGKPTKEMLGAVESAAEMPEAVEPEDSFKVAKAPTEIEAEGNSGMVRPSSIFSPLSPKNARNGGEGEKDSFRWSDDTGGVKKGRDEFAVGEEPSSDLSVTKGNAEKLAARNGSKVGTRPSLPVGSGSSAVSEETLGELLDKDQVEPRGDAAADEAAIAENARKIQNLTSNGINTKGLTESSVTEGMMEEVDVARGDLTNAAEGVAKTSAVAVKGAVEGESKLAKSRADAVNELARYGEESTLGDLSELEGDIDQLGKSGQDTTSVDEQAALGSEGKLAANGGTDNGSPCGQAAADLKEGMALSSHGDKLFHYRRAIRLCPTDPKFHNALGEFYLSLKRYDDARHEFKEALSVDSSFRKAQQNLKELEKVKAGG